MFRRLIALAVALAAGLALAGAGAYGRGRPAIVLSQPLPSVVRQGETVSVTGSVRGTIIVPHPCVAACLALVVRLEGTRTYGPKPSPAFWRTLAQTGCCEPHQRFAVSWHIPHKLALGPMALRVALVYPPAVPALRVLAATSPTQLFVGPAPVPCAPPTPPPGVPPGDGWIVGGLYIEGGPAPGLDECYSESYEVTATTQGGAVAASQHVAGGHSYTLVLPAGSYTLKAGCSVEAPATVTAGEQTVANTACLVP